MKLMVALTISGLPNKSVLTTEFSFSTNILALIFFSLFKIVCLWVAKCAYLRKKLAVDSISFPQLRKGLKNLENCVETYVFFKWLKPVLRRVRIFSLNGLFMIKTLLEFVPMKFNIFQRSLKKRNCESKDQAYSAHLLTENSFLKKLEECCIFRLTLKDVMWVSGSVHSTATTWYEIRKGIVF